MDVAGIAKHAGLGTMIEGNGAWNRGRSAGECRRFNGVEKVRHRVCMESEVAEEAGTR